MIDSDKIYSYFDDNHGPLTRSTKGWYNGECPFCMTNKLAVNPDKFSVKCWKGCFKGGVVNFVRKYLATTYFEAYQVIDRSLPSIRIREDIKPVNLQRDISLPDHFNSILTAPTPMGKRAQQYLRGRGFDMNYLDMLGVGYCGSGDYGGYIIIPFRRNGDIVYYIGRDFLDRGNRWRYKNPPFEKYGIGSAEVIFNEEALYLFDKVYMMEGWADAASIGNNAISIQGKDLSPYQADSIIKSPVKEVVVISDLNAELEALTMVEQIYKHKKTKFVSLVELGEFGKDVNAIGAGKVLDLEPEAEYITNLNSFMHAARSFNSHKKKLLV